MAWPWFQDPIKFKVFSWLVVHNKILTKGNLGHQGWTGNPCLLWLKLGRCHAFIYPLPTDFTILVDYSRCHIVLIDQIFSLIGLNKSSLGGQAWALTIMTFLWSTWKMRNDWTFRNIEPNFDSLLDNSLSLAVWWVDFYSTDNNQGNASVTLINFTCYMLAVVILFVNVLVHLL